MKKVIATGTACAIALIGTGFATWSLSADAFLCSSSGKPRLDEEDFLTVNDTLSYSFDEATGTMTVRCEGDMVAGELTEDVFSQAIRYPWSNGDGIYYESIKVAGTNSEKNIYIEPANAADIKHIVIEAGATDIGIGAFAGFSNVVSVSIPDTVTKIDMAAFGECENLTTIEIPDSVTEIGEDAFYNCKSLTEITIPNTVKLLGESAFYSSGLTTVTIPGSISEIPKEAFAYCDSLESVTVQEGVNAVCETAFTHSGLTNLYLAASVETLGYDICCACKNLRSVTILHPNCSIPANDRVFCNAYEAKMLEEPDSEGYHIVFNVTEKNAVIYGQAGSTAQTYAEDYGYTFRVVGEADPEPTEPATEPTEPVTEPTEPATEPTEPATEPTEPATEPTEPTEPATEPTEPTEPEPPLGDLNGDTTVNASDAAKVLIAAAAAGAGGELGLTEAQIKAADINSDTTVNASDAAVILIYSAAVGAGQEDAKITDFVHK